MKVTLPRHIEIPDSTPIIDFVSKAQEIGLQVKSKQRGKGLFLEASPRPTQGVRSISEGEFYDEVAKSIGKQRLTSHEASIAYSARLNAIYSFEFEGRTPSPQQDNVLVENAWRIAQERIEKHHHLFANPAY